MKKYFSLILVLLLGACASQAPAPVYKSPNKPYSMVSNKGDFYNIPHNIQCVPFARDVSGIQIRGDAHTWWHQASGKYKRSSVPKAGAVLVLSKTSRLKFGHLAVVKKKIDSRNILVSHTNWGGDIKTRCVVYNNMPAKDVSENNDWSKIRFWNYPSKSYGSIYLASGFIYPNSKPPLNDEQ